MRATHMRMLDQDVDSGWAQCCNNRIFRDPDVFCMLVLLASGVI